MKRTLLAAALAAAVVVPFASAQAEWPADRPIRIVVGFGAGGGTDIVARVVAAPLSELLRQSVVVENKPGAGGSIASEQVAKGSARWLHRFDDQCRSHRLGGNDQGVAL